LSASLQPWFTTHMISNPMENPFYRATQTVATEQTEDGNSFTNASALRSLPTKFPFIVLRCINSGTSLGLHQRPGCGGLLDNGIGEPTRRLRPRLRQVVGLPPPLTVSKPTTQMVIDLTTMRLGARTLRQVALLCRSLGFTFPRRRLTE
jgi:hypothetical protein